MTWIVWFGCGLTCIIVISYLEGKIVNPFRLASMLIGGPIMLGIMPLGIAIAYSQGEYDRDKPKAKLYESKYVPVVKEILNCDGTRDTDYTQYL